MILNRRQTTLLYELLSSKQYLSYDYLCEKSHSCEKTVRSDVKILNEMLAEKDISISLKKNKGFILQCDEEIRSNLVAKYLDGIYNSADLNQLMRNNCKIIECIFTTHDAVKIETLAERLNISPKTVSTLIKISKPMFNNYGLKLNVKPYYGIKVEGDENNVRYLLSDLSYSNYDNDLDSIFGEGMSAFGISKEEIMYVTEKMMNLVTREHLQISHVELRKLVARIIFGSIRHRKGFYTSFTDQQKKYLDEYFDLESFSHFFDGMERHTKDIVDENERYYLKMIFLASLDFSSDENFSFVSEQIRIDAHKLSIVLAKKLIELNIIDRVDERRFAGKFFATCVSAIIYKLFGISEDCPNSILKEIVCGTPFSSNIGNVLYIILREELDFRLGEIFRLYLSMSMYTAIREIDNKGDKLRMALFVSADVQSGATLKDRILDRYSSYIECIDVVSSCGILDEKKAKYDVIIYYGNKEPFGMPVDVKKIQLGYFFPIQDSRRFYRDIIIPRSRYESAFTTITKQCYEPNCQSVKSLEDLDQYIRKLIGNDKAMLKQYEAYNVNSAAIENETLNVVLFASNPKQCKTKLLKLVDCIQYRSTIISRVFINIVCIDKSPIALKTTEKLIRNLTKLEVTNSILFGKEPLDFVHYFLYNEAVKLD